MRNKPATDTFEGEYTNQTKPKVSEWSNELKVNMGRWNYKNHRFFIQQKTLDQQKAEIIEMVGEVFNEKYKDENMEYSEEKELVDDIINKLEEL